MADKILWSLIVLLQIFSSTISENASDKTSTTLRTAHNTSCGSYTFRELRNSSEVTAYCDYPKLFSTETRRCDPFSKVDCGNRPVPTTPCDYPNLNCTRPKGEDISLCTCEKDPDLNYDMCASLPDGAHIWPARHWSPFYVTCTSKRTIPTSCYGPSVMYNFFQNKCQLVYEVVNAAYSLSLSLDIPESLYHLISQRPTQFVHQQTPEITTTEPPSATKSEIRSTPVVFKTDIQTSLDATSPTLLSSPVCSGKMFETRVLSRTTPPLSDSSPFATTISESTLSVYNAQLSTKPFAPSKESSYNYLPETILMLSLSSILMPDSFGLSNDYSVRTKTENNIKTSELTLIQISGFATKEIKTIGSVNTQSVNVETEFMTETTKIKPTPSSVISGFPNTKDKIVYPESLFSTNLRVASIGVSSTYVSQQLFYSFNTQTDLSELSSSYKTLDSVYSNSMVTVSKMLSVFESLESLNSINPMKTLSTLSSQTRTSKPTFLANPGNTFPVNYSLVSSFELSTLSSSFLSTFSIPQSFSSVLTATPPLMLPSSLFNQEKSSLSTSLSISSSASSFVPSSSFMPDQLFHLSSVAFSSLSPTRDYPTSNIETVTLTTLMTKIDGQYISEMFSQYHANKTIENTDFFTEPRPETNSFQAVSELSAAIQHSAVPPSSRLIDEVLVSSEIEMSPQERYSTKLAIVAKTSEAFSYYSQTSQFVAGTFSNIISSKRITPASATESFTFPDIRNTYGQFSNQLSQVAGNNFVSSSEISPTSSPILSTAVEVFLSSLPTQSSLSPALSRGSTFSSLSPTSSPSSSLSQSSLPLVPLTKPKSSSFPSSLSASLSLSSSHSSINPSTSTNSFSPLPVFPLSPSFSSPLEIGSESSAQMFTSLPSLSVIKSSNLTNIPATKLSAKFSTRSSADLTDLVTSHESILISATGSISVLSTFECTTVHQTTSGAEAIFLQSSPSYIHVLPSFREQRTVSITLDILPTETGVLTSTKSMLKKITPSEEMSAFIRPSRAIVDSSSTSTLKPAMNFSSQSSSTSIVPSRVPVSNSGEKSSELKKNNIISIAVGVGVGGGILLIIIVFLIVIVVVRKRKKRGRTDFFQIRLPPELFMTRNL